ncbi:MAG: tyrosine-type recombinase/integrase [Caulobacter sp.]|nr:tyrosine-type recombinase/integrase [Caulobacter sp.]
MAKVDLSGVAKVRAKGRDYYYAWRGGPRLISEPGSAAFIEELAKAHAAHTAGDQQHISGLCADWRRSDAWVADAGAGGLSGSTKKNWTRWLDEIQVHFGNLRILQFDRPEIRQDIKRWRNKWKATPRAADMAKQVLSGLLSYAVEEGRLGSNPCFGISNLYTSDRSEIIWTDHDLNHFAETASIEVMFALRLACLTSLRQADLLKLSESHVGELAIEMKTGKSKGRLTYLVPLYDELRALLAEIQAHKSARLAELAARAVKNGRPTPPAPTTLLITQRGLPWGSGFGSSWNKAKIAQLTAVAASEGRKVEQAQFPLHFHDARGTAATRFHLAGFANGEIAEILGWSVDKVERIIGRYVKRDALLRDRIRRLNENVPGSTAAKPLQNP